MSDISDAWYTGSDITPTPTIKYRDITLTAGIDFDYFYKDNLGYGTATCIALDKNDYKGFISKTFNIIGYPITCNLSNCVGFINNQNWITTEIATLEFAVTGTGYVMPDSITVSGASYTYIKTKNLCTVVLSNATGPVTITINTILNYLCFTANTAGSTVTLGKNGSPSWSGSYSTDMTNWSEYIPGTTGAITLTNVGDKVYFKGVYSAAPTYSNYLKFSMTGSIAASGNVMSLIYSDFDTRSALTFNYAFYYLFSSCSVLTTAPELPATTLVSYCYSRMFYKCTSLTAAPELPAVTLTGGCYSQMFYWCTSLTTPPALPATTLQNYCYEEMFYRCTKLQVNNSLVSSKAAQSWDIWAPGAGGGSGYVYNSDTASNYPSGCLLNSNYYLINSATVSGNTVFAGISGERETGHGGTGFIRISRIS